MGTLALCLFIMCRPARAYDVEIDHDTSFQAYEVRAPATSTYWARHRLVDTLDLRLVQHLSEENDWKTGPRLQAYFRLRLNQDFSETCLVNYDICFDPTDGDFASTYHPLLTDGLIDVPFIYLDIDRLLQIMSSRLGRQLFWDRIGFVRIDGISIDVQPWPFISIETIGGILVRRTRFGGTDAFLPEGVPRVELSERLQNRFPYLEDPTESYLVGASVNGGDLRIVRAGVSYREVWEEDGTVMRKGGVGLLSRVLEPIQIESTTVWDLIDSSLIDLLVAAQLNIKDTYFRLSTQRHIPKFDWNTIWAYFVVAPVWREAASVHWKVSSRVEVGTTLVSRHADIEGQIDHDIGIEGYSTIGSGGFHFDLSGFGYSGSLGPVWGVDLLGRRRLIRWLELELLLSIWRINDSLQKEIQGTSISETIGLRLRVTDNTSFLTEFLHAYSPAIGQRFAFNAFLHTRAWR